MRERFFSFTFPKGLVRDPVIYTLVRRYGLTPLVYKASVNSECGWLLVHLSGDDRNIDEAILDLKCRGAHVIEGDRKLLELKEPSVVSSIRVRLKLPESKVREPVYSDMIIKHDVVINIRQAKIGTDHGVVDLEITGGLEAIDSAIESLKKNGIGVDPIEGNVIE